MSASFYRDNLQPFRASIKADPGEVGLCSALADANEKLDRIGRDIIVRVDNDIVAANHTMLDNIRRVADALKAAADAYQWGVQ